MGHYQGEGSGRQRSPTFYLDGIVISMDSMDIDPWYGVSCDGGAVRGYDPAIVVHCTAHMPLTRANRYRLEMFERCGDWAGNLGMLGPGYRCRHCGEFNPAGTAICHRCEGETERFPFITPTTFPFDLQVGDMSGSVALFPDDFELNWIDVDMLLTGRGDANTLIQSIAGTDVFSMPYGHSLDTGYHLCAYCGGAVWAGADCPGCGGERRPWQELMTIDHKCIYCGKEIKGGIVCPGCGRRVAGETFEFFRKKGGAPHVRVR